ncbi:MAG: DinB family protein [Bacteroidales bacterium]
MATASTTTRPATGKQQFLDTFEREHQTTMRVLRAYPTDKLDLKPHSLCKSAKELAWMFAMEQHLAQTVITTGLDLSKPMTPPPVPESWDAVLAAFDAGHREVVRTVEQMTAEQLAETTKFFVAPKTMGDVPKIDMLWMLLHDQIHHRGQFSIYLRMAGGKVPSIYGPTADEPWN